MNVWLLHNGNCERLKAATHALALGTAVVCGAYNLAAWLVRRQRHLAINTVLYAAAIAWETGHVRHHLAECASRDAKATPDDAKARPDALRAAS